MPQFHPADSRSTLLEAGYLDITTNYSGAQIFVNDNFIGISPLKQKIFASDELAITVIKDDLVPERFNIPIEKNKTTGVKVNMIEHPPPLKPYYTLKDFGWKNRDWMYYYIEPKNLKPEKTKKVNGDKMFFALIGVPVFFAGEIFNQPDLKPFFKVIGTGVVIGGTIWGLIGDFQKNYDNINYNNKLKSESKQLAETQAIQYNAQLEKKLSDKNKPIDEENANIQKERNEIQSQHTIFYQVGENGDKTEIKTNLPD